MRLSPRRSRSIGRVRLATQILNESRNLVKRHALEHALQPPWRASRSRAYVGPSNPSETTNCSVGRGAMQPSIFNIRVPLAGSDDVFLMNTLTDAQLLVSPDVAALLDRSHVGFDDLTDDGARGARLARRTTDSSSPTARPIGAALDRLSSLRQARHHGAPRHGPDDAAVQLRVRLLLPGRPRGLQQVRRQDDARDVGARRATGSRASSIGCSPRSSS